MMKPDPGPATVEELLRHTGWIRALALSLLADEHLAEDVSQETLRVALERRPYGGKGLKAWLAKVTRDLSLNFRRGEARRTAREKAVVPADPTSPAGEVVEWAERMQELVRAVAALDEPYQTAILLRYFEDLPPQAIAKRLGIPASTVRSHLKRGLEKLRLRLKTSYGAKGFQANLAFLAAPVSTSVLPATTGSISIATGISTLFMMNSKLKLTLTAALILLTSLAVWQPSFHGADPEAETSTVLADAEIAESASNEGLAAEISEPKTSRVETTPVDDKPRGTVTLRLEYLSGNPISGARVQVSYISTNWLVSSFSSEIFGYGYATNSGRHDGISDENGIAKIEQLRTDRPFLLYASKSGFALTGTMRASVKGAKLQDLGSLTMAAGSWMGIRVVDNEQNPVEGAQIKLVGLPVLPVGTLNYQSKNTAANGEAIFPYLVQGAHQISIRAKGFLPMDVPDALAGEPNKAWVELTLDRGLTIQGTVVQTDGNPAQDVAIYVIPDDDYRFDLPKRIDYDRKKTQTLTDDFGAYAVTGLVEKTRYRIVARRGPTVLAASEPLFAGQTARLELPASYSVHGRIVLPDGSPASKARVGFLNVAQPHQEHEVFHKADENGAFQIDLTPATYGMLAYHSHGRIFKEPLEIKADLDLGDVILSAGVPLTITALSAKDDRPIPNMTFIPLTEHSYGSDVLVQNPDDWKIRMRGLARGLPLYWYDWPETGKVVANSLQPGHHRLQINARWFEYKIIEVDLVEGEPQEITVRLNPSARLNLTILQPEGTPAIGQGFQLVPIDVEGRKLEDKLGERATTDLSGLAVFQQITAGRFRITLESDQWGRELGQVVVLPGENNLQFHLPARPNLEIGVSDSSGPVSGAKVYLQMLQNGDDVPFPEVTATGMDGWAHYSDLWPGHYLIRVERPGSLAMRREVDLSLALETRDFTFSGVTVSGKVAADSLELSDSLWVWLNGHSLPLSSVAGADWESLRKNWKSAISAQTTLDPRGNFSFRDVPPGLYRIGISAKGFHSSSVGPLRIYQKAVDGIEVPPLTLGSKLVIEVKGIAEFVRSKHVAYFRGVLYQNGNLINRTGFAEDGPLVFEPLSPGNYTFKVYALDSPESAETLFDTQSIVVGNLGTTTTVEWQPKTDS
jgi:RNA polymerase sigma-70 factor, ECF subfamily